MTEQAQSFLGPKRTKARRFALQALYQWALNPMPGYEITAQFESGFDMHKADISYFRDLVIGVINKADEVDLALKPALDRSLRSLDPVSVSILRLSTFEMMEKIETPYRVVINEAVKLAKKFGPEKSYTYINGVLDKTAKALRAPEAMAV